MSIFTRQFSSALFLSVSILAGCGGSSEVPNPAFGSGVPQSAPNPGGGLPQTEPNNEPILNLLDIAAVREIAVDPGQQPLESGEWTKFSVDSTWNWQLKGAPDAVNSSAVNLEYDADVYVVDMFAQLVSDSITPLKDIGRKVVCYFSAGTYEPWRPDKELFNELTLGNPHNAFPNEQWLDINDPFVAKLMANRMDMAVALGCDGVELDNVDGWIPSANSGFTFTLDDQLLFNKKLANEAHKRGLAVALKNNVEMIVELADWFDLVINEECFQYNECDGYLPMIEKGKPVFNAEYKLFGTNNEVLLPVIDYPVERAALCARSLELGFQTLFLPIELDGTFRISCR